MCENEETIADTSLLSNFARSGHLDLLKRLFPFGIWTTERVMEEIEKGSPKYPELNELLEARDIWLKVISELNPDEEQERRRLQTRHTKIRKGADATVLAVAKKRGLTVMTDDEGMVSVAKQEGVKVLRSKDILRIAVQKGLISRQQAKQIKHDIAFKARYTRILQDP